MNKIIITGDPVSGYQFIGPFDDFTEVNDFIRENRISGDFWIANLEPPQDVRNRIIAQKGGK